MRSAQSDSAVELRGANLRREHAAAGRGVGWREAVPHRQQTALPRLQQRIRIKRSLRIKPPLFHREDGRGGSGRAGLGARGAGDVCAQVAGVGVATELLQQLFRQSLIELGIIA